MILLLWDENTIWIFCLMPQNISGYHCYLYTWIFGSKHVTNTFMHLPGVWEKKACGVLLGIYTLLPWWHFKENERC